MAEKNIWQGARVRLRAIENTDWETHFLWDADSTTARHSHEIPFPQSRMATQKWAEAQALQAPQQDACRLQIEALESGQLVGTINSHSCQPRHGTFSYGVAILEAQRRQGYAQEAIALLLRYFFLELRYQKATVSIYAFNHTSLRLHEKMGFQQEGCLRRMIYSDGHYYDLFYYGITLEEFQTRMSQFLPTG